MFQTLVYLGGAAVCWTVYQAIVNPAGAHGDVVRWLLKGETPAIPVAALPEAKPAPRRRTRKAAA